MNNVALVTGASSGIGCELAKLFARDGYNLVLVARDQPKLDALAQDLQAKHGIEVKVIVKDLANPASPEEIFHKLEQESVQVDVLVNNAGTQVYGLFAEADQQQLLSMLQVNLITLTHLVKLFLPGMLARGRGRILNLASTGAFVPGPLNAVYCASKAYVLSFSEAIAAELAGTGVTVTALCPGATNTAFVTRHGLEDVRLFRSMMHPAQVAEIGYRALMKGRLSVVAGGKNHLQVLGCMLFAPFMPFVPPQMLKRIGTFVMGKI
jgi:short-subunit dehydrogenase